MTKSTCFYLDLEICVRRTHTIYSFSYGAGEVDMVVFDQNHVKQTDSVVFPTAAAHSKLIENSEPGRSLPCI